MRMGKVSWYEWWPTWGERFFSGKLLAPHTKLVAPHISAEGVTRFFREQHKIGQFELLERIAKVGVPVDVGSGDNLSGSWRTRTIAAPTSTRFGRKRYAMSRRGGP